MDKRVLKLSKFLILCLAALCTSPASAQQPKAAPAKVDKPAKLSALDAALEGIQKRVADIVKECGEQKNTALVTTILTDRHTELTKWLDDQEWEFVSQVVDITASEGSFNLTAKPTKSLGKFYENRYANTKGGIDSLPIQVIVSKDIVANVGKGDYVLIKGTVATKTMWPYHKQFVDALNGEELPVFRLFLPPLDRNSCLGVFVELTDVRISKTQNPKN